MKYFTQYANYYLTANVDRCVDKELILLIIQMLEDNNKNKIVADYLRVFTFEKKIIDGKTLLVVVEHQECPETEIVMEFKYKANYNIRSKLTIWAISDGIYDGNENVTFLFPEDY